jgi:hypothetical protein
MDVAFIRGLGQGEREWLRCGVSKMGAPPRLLHDKCLWRRQGHAFGGRTVILATVGLTMNWVIRHFRRYLEREPWGFCWRIGLESTVASLAAAAFLAVIFGTPKRQLLDLSMPAAFLMLLVVAPPVETLVFQAFPIFIVRMLKGSMRVQILVSTLLFSAAHFPEGITTGVSAGVIGGLYFAFSYAHWRTKSRWKSVWITTGCHAIHNGVAFILLVVIGHWR